MRACAFACVCANARTHYAGQTIGFPLSSHRPSVTKFPRPEHARLLRADVIQIDFVFPSLFDPYALVWVSRARENVRNALFLHFWRRSMIATPRLYRDFYKIVRFRVNAIVESVSRKIHVLRYKTNGDHLQRENDQFSRIANDGSGATTSQPGFLSPSVVLNDRRRLSEAELFRSSRTHCHCSFRSTKLNDFNLR